MIRSFHADAVVNVNSRLLYEAMTIYGKALAASERLFLMMFCNEQLAMGNWVGVPLRFFYRCFDLVEGVLTDSAYLANWLRERHQFGDGGRRTASTSARPGRSAHPRCRSRRRRSGAAAAGLLGRTLGPPEADRHRARGGAGGCPTSTFRMWGESVLTPGQLGEVARQRPAGGAYAHISELELVDADAWLYTSAWDGVPSQLLEVGDDRRPDRRQPGRRHR